MKTNTNTQINFLTKQPPPKSPPYDSPREAYNHLLYWTANPTLPRERKYAFVAIYQGKDYASARLYESFEAIMGFLPWCAFNSDIVVSLDHLRFVLDRPQCRRLYRLLTQQTDCKRVQRIPDLLPKSSKEDVHAILWNWLHSEAANLDFVKLRSGGKSQGKNNYLFRLEKITPDVIAGYPKQARQILGMILEDQKSQYSPDDLKSLSLSMLRRGVKTKQDPLTVLWFYMPQFCDNGLVEYPRKQYNKDEDETDTDTSDNL